MRKLKQYHKNLIFKESEVCNGFGVFARKNFAKGTILEESPVIPIPISESRSIKRFPYHRNLFEWSRKIEGDWSLVISTGLSVIFNHSFSPNVEYSRDHKRMALVFTALRPLRKGEELFINYNGDPESKEAVWFQVEENNKKYKGSIK